MAASRNAISVDLPIPMPRLSGHGESGARSGGSGFELQRHAIHAVAQAGGRRAVVEDVAEMPAAAAAVHLAVVLPQTADGREAHGIGQDAEETGPAGAALELRVG